MLTKFIGERDSLPLTYRGKRLMAAYMNRACARARRLTKATAEMQSKLIAEILGDCRAACEEGRLYAQEEYFLKSLQRNSKEGMELHPLESLVPDELKALRGGDCSEKAKPAQQAGPSTK